MHSVGTMVDSPKGKTMTDGLESLPERVRVVEHKLEHLTVSVDARFDRVDEAFADQRLYTEFAFERLEAKMDGRFRGLEAKTDAGFAQVDQRFVEIDGRLGQIDGRFARLERKIDQIIDLHLRKLSPDEPAPE